MSKQHVLTEESFKESMEQSFLEGKMSIDRSRAAYYEYKYSIPSVLNELPFSIDTLKSTIEYFEFSGFKGPYALFITNKEIGIIFTTGDFADIFDPVSKYAVLKTGLLGKLLGIDVYTDAYLDPSLHYIGTPSLRFKANAKVVADTTNTEPFLPVGQNT